MKRDPFKLQDGAVRDRKLTGYNADRNEGDNFLFLPIFSGWLGKTLKQQTVALFYIFLLVLFVSLIWRLIYLQVYRGNAFLLRAESNRTKNVILPAARGIISDKFGRPLVTNVSRFVLYINSSLLPDGSSRIELQDFLQDRLQSRERIAEIFQNQGLPFTPQLVAEDIPYELAIELIIKSVDTAAIQITYEPRRQYLDDMGLEHIIGYTGIVSETDLEQREDLALSDTVGKAGIEEFYDHRLRGENGLIELEVDAFGRIRAEIAREEPTSGGDISLTIDLDMQQRLNTILTQISVANGTPATSLDRLINCRCRPDTISLPALLSTLLMAQNRSLQQVDLYQLLVQTRTYAHSSRLD